MRAGYYWLRSHWDGRWLIAKYDGGEECCWQFTGSLHLLDMDEVLAAPNEDCETFELGPRIPEPATGP